MRLWVVLTVCILPVWILQTTGKNSPQYLSEVNISYDCIITSTVILIINLSQETLNKPSDIFNPPTDDSSKEPKESSEKSSVVR